MKDRGSMDNMDGMVSSAGVCRTRVAMLSKTTLQHLTWSYTRALKTASSQKIDLVDNLWKIKSRYKKPAHQDVTSMEGSEEPEDCVETEPLHKKPYQYFHKHRSSLEPCRHHPFNDQLKVQRVW